MSDMLVKQEISELRTKLAAADAMIARKNAANDAYAAELERAKAAETRLQKDRSKITHVMNARRTMNVKKDTEIRLAELEVSHSHLF